MYIDLEEDFNMAKMIVGRVFSLEHRIMIVPTPRVYLLLRTIVFCPVDGLVYK